MRGAWVVLLPIMLGGCLPPAVTVATLAADGVSYAANGKSATDNGLSAVKQQDCASWHFFVGRAICEDPRHPVPPAPLEAHGKAPTAVAVAQPVNSEPPPSSRYLAIGSFAERGNAERFANSFPDLHPQIRSVRQGDVDLHRVILGPLDETQIAALRLRGINGFVVAEPEAEPARLAVVP